MMIYMHNSVIEGEKQFYDRTFSNITNLKEL